MQQSVDRVSNIENVLDYARGVSNGIGLRAERALIEETLRSIVAEIPQLHPDREIDHMFEIECPVLVDHGRLGQVFSNLISNAITHGAPDQPIRTRATYRDGIVELWVTNGGNPIPEEDVVRLFQPFKRSGQNADGLGLGCSSRRIAKAHGWVLEVSSDETETRFTPKVPARSEI